MQVGGVTLQVAHGLEGRQLATDCGKLVGVLHAFDVSEDDVSVEWEWFQASRRTPVDKLRDVCIIGADCVWGVGPLQSGKLILVWSIR